MNIVQNIRDIAEAQGWAFRYGSDEELNQYADNTEMPAVFMALLQQGRFVTIGGNKMQQQDVVLTFFDKTSWDYSSEENHAIIEQCRRRVLTFLAAFSEDGTMSLASDVTSRNVYLQFASVYTGVSISFTVRLNESDCVDVQPSKYDKLLKEYLALKADFAAYTADVEEGKLLLSTAISSKGVPTAASDSLQIMAAKVSDISTPDELLIVGTDEVKVDSAAQDIMLNIFCTHQWSITLPSWITSEQLSGVGIADIVLHVAANEGDERQGVVVVRDEDKQQEVEVMQGKFVKVIEVLPKSFDLNNDSNECTLSISTKAEWSLQGLPFWITADKTSGEGNAVVTLYVDKSLDKEDRAVNLQVVANGESESVEVKQEHCSWIRRVRIVFEGLTTDASYTIYYKNKITNEEKQVTYSIPANTTDYEIDFEQESWMTEDVANVWMGIPSYTNYIKEIEVWGDVMEVDRYTRLCNGNKTDRSVIIHVNYELLNNEGASYSFGSASSSIARLQIDGYIWLHNLYSFGLTFINITQEGDLSLRFRGGLRPVSSSFGSSLTGMACTTLDIGNVPFYGVRSVSYSIFYCPNLTDLYCDSVIDLGAISSQINMNGFLRKLPSLVNIHATFANIKWNMILSDSPLLSYSTALNIINGLYDFASAGNTSKHTLTFHANTKALLTDDDIALATSKGWTIS